MKPFFIVFALFIFWGCGNESTDITDTTLWEYSAKNHQAFLDQTSKPLLICYQNILTGFYNHDTLLIKNSAKEFATQIDTAIAHLNIADTVHQQIALPALQNIQSELEALLLESSELELNKSLQMLSVQLLNYFGQIGFQQNTIYIFNFPLENAEAQYWLGWSKTANNPYDNTDKKRYTAVKVLQE
jgi:hypothetical protein